MANVDFNTILVVLAEAIRIIGVIKDAESQGADNIPLESLKITRTAEEALKAMEAKMSV